MSELALSVQQPTRQALEAKGRSAPLKVTGKLREAIEHMVWGALTRPDAAAKAGLTDHALYVAFRKPHVKAHYLSELEVLRTSEKARSIHRIVAIRDKAENMPAFQAARYLLEDGGDTAARSMGSVALPGLTIQIINHVAEPAAVRVLDANASNIKGIGAE